MTFVVHALSGSSRHRLGRTLAMTAILLAWQTALGARLGLADSPAVPTGVEKIAGSVGLDDAVDPTKPVAFQIAASGVLDPSEPAVPGPTAPVEKVWSWRNARPKLPLPVYTSTSPVPAVSLAPGLDRSGDGGDSSFVFSRSVAPLLAPPSIGGEMSGPVLSLPLGVVVGSQTRAKPRGQMRFR